MTATGISTCSIAALLALLDPLVDFVTSSSIPSMNEQELLIVHIKPDSREPISNITTDDQAVRPLPQEKNDPVEFAESHRELTPDDSPESPTESQTGRDWQVIASEAAKASVDEFYEQEENRQSMWRRSHSVMFQPAREVLAGNNEPLLSDVQFRQYSRVLGLGINIGRCFIGVPLAGVPVEKRQAAITIFVCI